MTPAASSKFRRSSIDVSRGVRKPRQKIIDFWMPFWVHLGSIWPPFYVHFGMISRFSFGVHFRCVFFVILLTFMTNPTFDFVLSPTRGAIFRVFAMSQKVPKQLQNLAKTGPEINPKTRKTPLQNPPKNASDFGTLFARKMIPK